MLFGHIEPQQDLPLIRHHSYQLLEQRQSVEIGMPYLGRISFLPKKNNDELRVNLDLLEERQEIAHIIVVVHQRRMARLYNFRVKPRNFNVGDVVLGKVTSNTKEVNSNCFCPNQEGFYKIIRTMQLGTYYMEDIQGKTMTRPWNAQHFNEFDHKLFRLPAVIIIVRSINSTSPHQACKLSSIK